LPSLSNPLSNAPKCLLDALRMLSNPRIPPPRGLGRFVPGLHNGHRSAG
jgi:hypothetical protein